MDANSSNIGNIPLNLIKVGLQPVAVYVHIPFCPSKCGYCDFNSFAMSGNITERTTRAMIKEISTSPHRGRKSKTVFFGGGTPTFLASNELTSCLQAVLAEHPADGDIEITSEANPGTADAHKFLDMRKAGFNRLSIGAQSFLKEDLIRLGRIHGPSEIGHAVRIARAAGFENLNLDLMFGLPGQTRKAWKTNLEFAIGLGPDHLSLYGLTIEPNTRFHKLHRRGMLDLPEEGEHVEMYEIACEAMHSAGYRQYEISNFARPGFECRHNLCYWKAEEYLGYGPGAVGCLGSTVHKTRYTNVKHPERYCDAVENGEILWCESEFVDEKTQRFEQIMLGVRLNEGLYLESEEERSRAERLVGRGWLESSEDKYRLTDAGRHFCSAVVAELA